jgi:hypothetical protein
MSDHAHRQGRPRRDRRDKLAIAILVSRTRGCICEPIVRPRHVDGHERIAVLHDAWCSSVNRGTTLVLRPVREQQP